MAITYEPIATTTLGSAAGTVSFTSISAAYTDIIAVINGATVSGDYGLWYRINNDSGTNYSNTYLLGNGTSASSSRDTSQTQGIAGNNISTTRGTTIVHFMNYSNTTTYKTIINRGNEASATAIALVNLWRSTSAINSINIEQPGGGNFAAGSSFTLYGIKAE